MRLKRAPSDVLPTPHRRLVIWLGVFTLLLSLLTPLVTVQAAEAADNLAERLQGVPPDCEEGFVVSDDGLTCVEDPNTQLQQEEQQEEQQLPTCPEGQIPNDAGQCVQDPSACEPGTVYNEQTGQCEAEALPVSIQLTKYECPPDAVDYQQDPGQLNGNCGAPTMPYTMSHGGPDGGVDGPVQVQGFWEWPNEAPGQHWISEQIPDGYTVAVYCTVYDPNTGPTGLQPQGVDQSGTIYVDVPSGWYLYCDWYNIPPDQGGTVTVYKWDCAPGTEYGRELDYYQGGLPDQDIGPCESEHLGIQISLIDANGPHDTTTQSNGTQWNDVVPDQNGSFQIMETAEGYGEPMVFCGTLDEQTQSPVPATNGGITLTPTTQPFDYQCNWYNIPVPPYAQILIEKYWCDEGYVPAEDASQSDIMSSGSCQATGPQTSFSLTGPGGPYEDMMVAGNPGDTVSWPLTEGGDYTVMENFQNGGYTLRVYCHLSPLQVNGTGNGLADPQPQTVMNGNSIQWTAQEGYYWICTIFNISGGDNSVTVYKWDCAPGTEYGRELDYYQGGLPDQDTGPCETEHGGLPIALADGRPDSPHESTTDHNEASWDGVVLDANGSIQVTVTDPPGYGDPMVFCGTLDEEGQSPVTATGGAITLTPTGEPFDYQCNWYNIPDDDYNHIDFYKYVCETTAPEGSDKSWYEQNCTLYTEGVDFDLQYPDGTLAYQRTNDQGYTSWSGVGTGTWSVTEVIPGGWGDPVVFCRYVEWPDEAGVTGDWAMFEAPGGAYQNGFGYEGMRIECHWYNFPVDEYNYVDLYKYECLTVAPENADQSWYEQNCTPVSGWNFNVGYEGGGSSQATGENGQASWSGVPTGAWNMSETVPEGYGEPVIWCRYVEWPDGSGETGEWTMYTPQEGYFESNFEDGNWRIECYWYNFPGELDPLAGDSKIIIYKYWCTGAPTSQDFGLYQESCTETMDNVTFTLGATSPKATTGGAVEWDGLVTNEAYTIQESVPPGYGEPVIWCGYTYQDGVEIDPQYEPYQSSGGGIQVTLENGPAWLVCYWYNFPGDENSVTVYKYDCDYEPAGFQSLNQWLEACPNMGADGRMFNLTDSEATSTDMQTTGGSATWTGVPEGPFTLSETLEEGWGDPVIWCGWAAVTMINGQPTSVHAPAQNYIAPGGVHSGSIPYPGTTYICYWFNIPVDYSSVTVYKYNCPEGYLEGVVPDPLMAYQDMCTTPGNGIEFTLEYGEYSSTKPITNGTAVWKDVPVGNFTITETIPAGYDPPIWYCGPAGSLSEVDAPEGVHTGAMDSEQMKYVCWVFNFPDPDRTVTVYKWLCPEGYESFEGTYDEWSTNCTMPMDGVSFTFSDANGNWPLPTFGGMATWYAAAQGEVSLDEHIPPGYFEPVVYCSLSMVNGAAAFEDFTEYPATDGMISRTIDASEYEWICHFFNIPKGPGEITVYKWLCPPGYDFYGWGADPKVDCTEAWDGVPFTLDQPVGPNLMTNTGDSVPGAVYFGGLDPGEYVITETVPAGIEYVFVLDCTGTDVDKVHPYPLQWGNTLQMTVAGGDSIVCNWYNVPPPDNGWVTVYKYSCWTTTFTKEVDCEIYEHGASFELFGVPSDTSYGVGTTDEGGLYTWNDLEEGAYTIEEISHKPCKITSTKVDGQGNAWVDDNQGTIIKVYNCKSSTTTTPTTPGTTPVPKVPGKVPGKYPNTGADPSASDGVMPMLQETPEGTQTVEELDELADDYYRVSCLEGTPAATAAATTAPTEGAVGTPAGVPTEEVFDLPIDEEGASTPEADGTPAAEENCARGALPERVAIDAANVNAEVETLEIVDGLMQQPTGPELVTWYKETGRLGESNNIVIAGHLNYLNVPEGVFFYLDQLQEGDRVEITGDDGMVYIYEVQWVRQESNLEPPAADVIGPTDEPSLTLITCGGPWNAGIAEYEERTVARAVQVDVVAAEDSGDAAAFSPLLAA